MTGHISAIGGPTSRRTGVAAVSLMLCLAASGGFARGDRQDSDLAVAAGLQAEALAFCREGKWARAEPGLRRALAIRRRRLGSKHPDTVASVKALATAYERQSKHAEADALYDRFLATDRAAYAEPILDVAWQVVLSADPDMKAGRYDRAEALNQRALAVSEKAGGTEHVQAARILTNLATLWYNQRKKVDVTPVYDRCKRILQKAHGPDHPAVGRCLNNFAALYQQDGQHEQAERLYRQALALWRKALGEKHPSVVNCLNNLATSCRHQGKYAEGVRFGKRAQSIQKETLPANHPDVARTSGTLAGLYQAQGAYDQAEPLARRAVSILEQARGPGHPDVAGALNGLAEILARRGKYDQAVRLYRRALAIREGRLGATSPDVATTLNDLGSTLKSQGKYAEAERLYARALGIREQAYGPDHPIVGVVRNNLADLYWSQGRYEDAERLYQRVLAVWEKALGPDHPNVATCVNNLAVVYEWQGRYDEAERLHKRALAAVERALGPEHPAVAVSLNNLSQVYKLQGRYDDARHACERALAIYGKVHPPGHPAVANCLNNLATIYTEQGDYSRAERFHRRALAIRERALGRNHPAVATSLNNLGTLYSMQGRHADAEALYERALTISVKTLSPDHPDVALCFRNLAVLAGRQANYEEAERLYKSALEIWKKALGATHPRVSGTMLALAALYRRQEHYAEAEKLAKSASALMEQALGPNHPEVALGRVKLARIYASQGRFAEARPLLDRSLTDLEQTPGVDPSLVAAVLINLAHVALDTDHLERAWEHAGRARGLLLKARPRSAASPLSRSSVFADEYPTDGLLPCLALHLRKKVDVLHLLEQERALGLRELLAEARAPTVAVLPEKDRVRVQTALGRINVLNRTIRMRMRERRPVEALSHQLRQAEIDYDALMSDLGDQYESFTSAENARAVTGEEAGRIPVLERDAAVVGWVQYRNWVYGYVVRSTGVHWVDLGAHAERRAEGPAVRRIIAACRNRHEAPAAGDLALLYRLRWAPLEPQLKNVGRVIVIAQGWAAFLPIEMLLTETPAANEREMATWSWLSSRYEISYAPSVTTLDILCRRRRSGRENRSDQLLVCLADPPFDAAQLADMTAPRTPARPPASANGQEQDAQAEALRRLVRSDPSAVPPRLPGTRREARLLAQALGPDRSLLLLGPEASERRLAALNASGALKRCRYVHLATHGLIDGERPDLSALALARVPPDRDFDGLLQMREVFHLKLDADLVVLSACRTGLGKALRGEGMVGLSTAFFFAGSRSLVISLWNVPDASTALLMHRFYKNLGEGQRRSAALQHAKDWLRNSRRSGITRLAREEALLADIPRGLGPPVRSEEGKPLDDHPFAHPYYWAGFVLTGDPG